MAIRKKCPIRSILIRYMADYTESTSGPVVCNSGFFAIHIVDTGKVWLSESNNFKQMLSAFKRNVFTATCVKEAFERGSKLELWFHTQPKRFSMMKLEEELIDNDLLADRKSPNRVGPGKLYCVRHRTTKDYFVVTDRINSEPNVILGGFLSRLTNMSANGRNKNLATFITNHAEDILRGFNFDIHEIAKFSDNEDKKCLRQAYINQCQYGRNLNLNAVD